MSQRMETRKGLNIVFTGDGKGKTSAAMGVLMRASGHDLSVGVIQFIKGTKWNTGESKIAQKLDIPFETLGDGFVWNREGQQKSIQAAQAAWEEALHWILSSKYDVLILDEITHLFQLGWLDVDECIEWVKAYKPPLLHIVWTGRYAPRELIAFADMVTEMREIKHPFKEQRLTAQLGIDY
jgi:cob(I)alamin adenosyltransferase